MLTSQGRSQQFSDLTIEDHQWTMPEVIAMDGMLSGSDKPIGNGLLILKPKFSRLCTIRPDAGYPLRCQQALPFRGRLGPENILKHLVRVLASEPVQRYVDAGSDKRYNEGINFRC